MKHSLVLASGSFARQNMLRDAGYEFDVMPARIDEEKIIQELPSTNVEKISLVLAQEKAKYVSIKCPDNYIIGSDQILIIGNKIYSKAKNKEEAKLRIKEFRGNTHTLHSSVSVFKNGKELFSYSDAARLTMRSLGDEDIDKYCAVAGDVLTSCVGCYALESVGIRLFERIEGDYFTILGMPLLPLSNFLDSKGFGL